MKEVDIKKAAGLIELRDELRGYLAGARGKDTRKYPFAEVNITFSTAKSEGTNSEWTADYAVPKAALIVALSGALKELDAEIAKMKRKA